MSANWTFVWEEAGNYFECPQNCFFHFVLLQPVYLHFGQTFMGTILPFLFLFEIVEFFRTAPHFAHLALNLSKKLVINFFVILIPPPLVRLNI